MLIDASGEKEDFDVIKPDKTKNSMNLNTILYGPPGTGKTYHTINKALEILGEDVKEKSRSDKKAIYDQKVADGQIVFTTFHQSMSYEDFVEGIKPKTTIEKKVIYEIEDGIFKMICAKAHNAQEIQLDSFESVYQRLLNEIDNKPGQKLTLPQIVVIRFVF